MLTQRTPSEDQLETLKSPELFKRVEPTPWLKKLDQLSEPPKRPLLQAEEPFPKRDRANNTSLPPNNNQFKESFNSQSQQYRPQPVAPVYQQPPQAAPVYYPPAQQQQPVRAPAHVQPPQAYVAPQFEAQP